MKALSTVRLKENVTKKALNSNDLLINLIFLCTQWLLRIWLGIDWSREIGKDWTYVVELDVVEIEPWWWWWCTQWLQYFRDRDSTLGVKKGHPASSLWFSEVLFSWSHIFTVRLDKINSAFSHVFHPIVVLHRLTLNLGICTET